MKVCRYRTAVRPQVWRRTGFSLMELLVSMSIIVILGTLLFPALRKGIDNKDRMVSSSRLRNCAQAILLWGADNDSKIMCAYEADSSGKPVQATFRSQLTSGGYLPGTSVTCIDFGCEVQKRMHHYTTDTVTFNMSSMVGNYILSVDPQKAQTFMQLMAPSQTALIMHGIYRNGGFGRGITYGTYKNEVTPVFAHSVLIGFADGNVRLVDVDDIPGDVSTNEKKLFWYGKY